MNAVPLVARARGLSLHLLGDEQLAAIERAASGGALVSSLVRAGFAASAIGGGSPAAVEAALRARDRVERAIIDRWAEGARDAVDVVDADDDRRSLRAMIRGAAAGAPASARLLGAVPTASLPERLLALLAAASSTAELATVLVRHAHPAAATVVPLLTAATPDLLAVELALGRWFAATVRPRRADHAVAAHVGELLDVDNAGAALLLAERGRDLEPDAHFLDGGARLTRARFVGAARAPLASAGGQLAPAFTRTPLAAVLASPAPAPEALEQAALRWHLATQTSFRRREPLGLAQVLWLLLRRRLERVRVRRAAWRVAMTGAS